MVQVGPDPDLWPSGSTETEGGQIPGPMALISHNRSRWRLKDVGAQAGLPGLVSQGHVSTRTPVKPAAEGRLSDGSLLDQSLPWFYSDGCCHGFLSCVNVVAE